MTRHLIGGLSVLALVLAAGCASTGNPATHAATAPSATPSAASSARPASTPLTLTALVTGKRPLAGTKVGVTVVTVPGARITVVAHFQAGDRKEWAHAGAAGAHTFWFRLGSATPGFQVKVSVSVSANGQTLNGRAWFIPRQRPPAVSSPSAAPPSGCYLKTDSGNCYEPGEFCRTSDHGVHGVAGDGEPIVCVDNNGWRWEPA